MACVSFSPMRVPHFSDIDVFIHGTTLATNAIIERRGAQTALIATDGFRDVLDIGTESRYDQYDLTIEKPKPLVPRACASPCPSASTRTAPCVSPLDEAAVRALAPRLRAAGRRERRDRLPALLCQSRARAARGRDPGRGDAGHLRHAVVGGVSGDPRIRAHLDGGRQRLCAAADRRLSRAHGRCAAGRAVPRRDLSGDVGRRRHLDRDGAALSGAPRRVRAGRRRDLRGADRGARSARARCCRSTWAAPRRRSA